MRSIGITIRFEFPFGLPTVAFGEGRVAVEWRCVVWVSVGMGGRVSSYSLCEVARWSSFCQLPCLLFLFDSVVQKAGT